MDELLIRYRRFVACLRELERSRPIELDPSFDLEAFRRPLVNHIQGLLPRAAYGLASDERRLLSKIQYAMAVLADEVMTVGVDWAGIDAWSLDYLETQFAGTREGGDRIFEDIDELLRVRDPSTIPLARIYLLTLALGFRSEGEQRDARSELDRRLYLFVSGKSPLDPIIDEQLFPAAHDYVERTEEPPTHARTRLWWLSLVLALIAWLGLSYVLWARRVAPINDTVEFVEGSSRHG